MIQIENIAGQRKCFFVKTGILIIEKVPVKTILNIWIRIETE